jgi:hypothetical protein
MQSRVATHPGLTRRQVLFMAAVGVAVVSIFTAVTWQQAEAADEYVFLVRGDITDIDSAQKTITVNSRYVGLGNAGENDLAGNSVEMSVSKALFFKYNAKGTKVRTTLGSFNVGDEVVVKGAKKSGGNYNASVVTLNDNKVNLRGVLQGHDVGNKILEIDINKIVTASNGKMYRPASFKVGERVNVYYGNSTKFFSRDGVEINPDEVANDNEQVTVTGLDVRFGSRLVAGPDAKVTDGRYKF